MSPEPSPPRRIEADWTWTGRQFEEGVQVVVGDDGRIADVVRPEDGGSETPDRRLRDRALLPGFVNAHSHAFQRGLRGLGESYHQGQGDFWSWREAMYALVERLDAEAFFELSRAAFREMRDAGMTTVGEFHYLHHGPEGEDYACDRLILDAAREAGIRIVLLNAYYRTGAPGKALQGAQRRFATPDLETYWQRMDHLQAELAGPLESLGAVAHSFRAASPREVAALWSEAVKRDLVFHMHIEEQPREIEEVRAAYGHGPMELLNDEIELSGRFTGVHCTHSTALDLTRFAAHGARVCLCPLTEASLADGFADLPAMLEAGIVPCLGSDSNARISMVEEMRWMEYAQRLARRKRGIARGETGEVASVLLDAATAEGAAALGIEAGEIVPGRWADLAVVDLTHPSLEGVPLHSSGKELAAAIAFGAADGAIESTAVAGRWRRTGEEG